ncbi:hypothetical protein OQA88_3941 [Cercophora sp. LCS_1]
MVVNIPDHGLVLESSAKPMAGLPTQAFALTLSDSMIEGLIECFHNGQDIQLSLGSNPAILFDNQEISIPNSPEYVDYDIYYSSTDAPTAINKLPRPAMSILRAPKPKPKAPRALQAAKTDKPAVRTKPNGGTPKVSAVADKDAVAIEDEAIANLKNSYAKAEQERRDNSSTLVDTPLPGKGSKAKAGKVKHLAAPTSTASRSHPGSPALSAIASPSLGPASTPAQDRLKQQRYPIIHELAVQEQSFNELLQKYAEGTEQDFTSALNKVADFDDKLQKWALKKMYWKELDVFEYNYERDEDRQKAIDNAVKQFDRMRLGASDPLWQKLLPKTERNKGVCLSKLQAAIASRPTAPPKVSAQKTDTSSVSGADSERDDSTSSGAKKAKGGEPMSRSSSQTLKKKPAATEAQVKRPQNSKKPATATVKAPAKTSPTKPAAPAKLPTTKGGRVLSKEFITDSDSDDDEVPLSISSSMPKAKTKAASPPVPAAKTTDRLTEKAKTTERPRESPVPKAKPASAPKQAAKEREKEKDTIRAQVVAKPMKAPVKRQRDADDDDSSSSGTPLSKRIKPGAKTQTIGNSAAKQRALSDASQMSRGTSSGLSMTKSKNTSPVKSSPLASSPPTNASELEQDRPPTVRDSSRGRGREHDRDTIVSSAGSSTGSSIGAGPGRGTGSGAGETTGKKRPAEDSSSGESAKRQRLSEEILNKANRFKRFYTRYEQLHQEINAMKNPPEDQVASLIEMRERLVELKMEIYREATAKA